MGGNHIELYTLGGKATTEWSYSYTRPSYNYSMSKDMNIEFIPGVHLWVWQLAISLKFRFVASAAVMKSYRFHVILLIHYIAISGGSSQV